jgi:hypothetical protein
MFPSPRSSFLRSDISQALAPVPPAVWDQQSGRKKLDTQIAPQTDFAEIILPSVPKPIIKEKEDEDDEKVCVRFYGGRDRFARIKCCHTTSTDPD